MGSKVDLTINFEISMEDLNEIIREYYGLENIYFNSASPIFGRKCISIRGTLKGDLRKVNRKRTGGESGNE